MTNLEGRSKASALLRTTTTYLWLFYYTLFLASIMVMFYFYPDFSFGIPGLISTKWSELPLLVTKEGKTVNLLLASTIALGWSSLLLDLFLAGLKYLWKKCWHSESNNEANRNDKKPDVEEVEAIYEEVKEGKSKTSFWDETVLLQGHKYWRSFTIFPFIFFLALVLILIF